MRRLALILLALHCTAATCSKPLPQCTSHYDCDQDRSDIVFDHVCSPTLHWCEDALPEGAACTLADEWRCASQQCNGGRCD